MLLPNYYNSPFLLDLLKIVIEHNTDKIPITLYIVIFSLKNKAPTNVATIGSIDAIIDTLLASILLNALE